MKFQRRILAAIAGGLRLSLSGMVGFDVLRRSKSVAERIVRVLLIALLVGS